MPSSKPDSSGDRRKIDQGRKYEDLAAQFYLDNGFEVIDRNWRAGHKEIDLIVRKADVVAFVEVKSSMSHRFGHPVERVDRRKVQNLSEAAQRYVIENNLHDVDLRFDVVTFNNGQLEHFPDAFTVD